MQQGCFPGVVMARSVESSGDDKMVCWDTPRTLGAGETGGLGMGSGKTRDCAKDWAGRGMDR